MKETNDKEGARRSETRRRGRDLREERDDLSDGLAVAVAESLETVGGVEKGGEGSGRNEADEPVEAEAGTGEDEDACRSGRASVKATGSGGENGKNARSSW